MNNVQRPSGGAFSLLFVSVCAGGGGSGCGVGHRGPDAARCNIIGIVRTTRYFEQNVLENPRRWDITREMCERIVREAEHAEEQENGLLRFWG